MTDEELILDFPPSEDKISYLVIMPQYRIGESRVVAVALDTLRRPDIPAELGQAIGEMLNQIPTPAEVQSVLELPEMAIEKVENSLNEWERLYYLRGIANLPGEWKSRHADVGRLIPVFQAGNIREKCLVLEILTSACQADVDVDRSFVEIVISEGAVKLGNPLIDFLIVLSEFNAERVASIIQQVVLAVITQLPGLRWGRLLSRVPHKAELFTQLVEHIDDFAINESAGAAFFDALISVIDCPDHATLFASFCAGQMTADCRPFLFAAICEFYRSFKEYQGQINLEVLLTRLDQGVDVSNSLLVLVGQLIQAEPGHCIRVLRRFIGYELPPYKTCPSD
jgi:hypothetical protein